MPPAGVRIVPVPIRSRHNPQGDTRSRLERHHHQVTHANVVPEHPELAYVGADRMVAPVGRQFAEHRFQLVTARHRREIWQRVPTSTTHTDPKGEFFALAPTACPNEPCRWHLTPLSVHHRLFSPSIKSSVWPPERSSGVCRAPMRHGRDSAPARQQSRIAAEPHPAPYLPGRAAAARARGHDGLLGGGAESCGRAREHEASSTPCVSACSGCRTARR